MKKIGIASDHAGYDLKEFLVGYLDSLGYEVFDYGCDSPESCDYPDYAHPLALDIEQGTVPCGIAICGTANGISITLNKHQGIRAAVCLDSRKLPNLPAGIMMPMSARFPPALSIT